jgi:hypothetical protein
VKEIKISTNWSGRETGRKPEDKIRWFLAVEKYRILEITF